jgi:dihydrofolate reductase
MGHLACIVAATPRGIIGRKGTMPWRLPSDLKRFKDLTMGKPVIMGRTTFDSLPNKPLKGRANIVLTRSGGEAIKTRGGLVAHSPEQALALAGSAPEVFVIGGAEIYRLFLPRSQYLYLTTVHSAVRGDARFDFVADEWEEMCGLTRDKHDRRDSCETSFRVLRHK